MPRAACRAKKGLDGGPCRPHKGGGGKRADDALYKRGDYGRDSIDRGLFGARGAVC